jgi:hypothetical protein
MNSTIAKRVTRISLYLRRVCEDMRRGDAVGGMADAAELCEQARRLYAEFEAESRKKQVTEESS